MALPARSLLPWIGGASAALFVPLLFPLVTGRVFTRDDFAALHLPFRYLYREALQSGESFLWTSAYHSGFYLHGEGIAGMAHPLHLLLYRFLPLGLAFNLEIVTPFVAMLVGTWLLLRRFGLASEAAWFGAMVFTFSGFNLFNLMHMNHAAVIAHLPWLLLASHVLLTSPDRRNRALAFAGFALVVGSQLLIGNPQYVWLTSVVLVYMIACLWYAGAPSSRVALLVGAGVLGALIGAVQLLPTLDFARESTRMAYSQEEALSFSLSPLNLVQLWSPFAFRFRIHAPEAEALIVHEFIVYNGAFCTIALAWLAMRWRQQTRRGLLVALFALAAISLRAGDGTLRRRLHLAGALAGTAQSPRAGASSRAVPAGVERHRRGGVRGSRGHGSTRRAGRAATSVAARDSGRDEPRDQRAGWRCWPSPPGRRRTVWRSPAFCAPAPWSAVHRGHGRAHRDGGAGVRWALPALIVFVACDQGFWGYSYAYRWGPIQRIDELIAARRRAGRGAARRADRARRCSADRATSRCCAGSG